MASLIHRQVTLPGNRLYVSTAHHLQTKLVQGTRRAHHRQVAVAAAPPKGVTQPPRSPIVPPPMFGFVDNAEVLNSRAAMIGFFALLILEAVAGKGLLELIGVTVGKGLDIGL
ncbi:Light-harvesting complex-like protein OHP1 [Picochlorum sp. SENEW3]|nr:Light-harvesting complex-like protein OHP1 [Picochlorum sp. SENEW3]WPT15717.1 Light-harvesting complex-like protein OHP1 [Picochlorum sp. SENEW3]